MATLCAINSACQNDGTQQVACIRQPTIACGVQCIDGISCKSL